MFVIAMRWSNIYLQMESRLCSQDLVQKKKQDKQQASHAQ